MWQAMRRKLSRRSRRGRGKVIQGPWRGDQIHQRVREVAARYQQAGEHDRLSLWLQHRGLRPLLTRLEKHRQD